MVVRARAKNISKPRKPLSNGQHLRMEEPNEIYGDECDFALTVTQYDRPRHERIMNACCLTVLAEASHVDGLTANVGRDICLTETDGKAFRFLPVGLCHCGDRQKYEAKDSILHDSSS